MDGAGLSFAVSVFMTGRLFDSWQGNTNDYKHCNRFLPALYQYLDLVPGALDHPLIPKLGTDLLISASGDYRSNVEDKFHILGDVTIKGTFSGIETFTSPVSNIWLDLINIQSAKILKYPQTYNN